MNRISKAFILMMLIFSFPSFAQVSRSEWALAKSHLEYEVSFPLKLVHGISDRSKGKVKCEPSYCEFLVACEVKSFDSGDSNRDVHMWEVTHAPQFPYVIVRGRVPQPVAKVSNEVDLEIEFAGEKQTIKAVPLTWKSGEQEIEVAGRFDISLKNFHIKAPSLLGVSIDDRVKISFATNWH